MLMPQQPQDNSGEDDMEPMPKAEPERDDTGELDDSPVSTGNLDHAKANKKVNETLSLLGAGSPHKGCV